MPDSDRRSTDNPEFSVIIPTFNRAHVLPRAIDSVLGQSHGDFELLVVDDGSADGTAQCVARYQDARIQYIRHEQNRGQNTALNTGIAVARGTFVSFLDSDDAWDPAMLEAVRAKFGSDNELGWVYTAFRARDVSGQVRSALSATLEGWVFAEALAQGHVSPPTAFSVRRTCFDVVGTFELDNIICNDDVMCLKLAKAFKVGRVDATLATIHSDGGSRVTEDQALAAMGYYRLHEKFRTDIVTLLGRRPMAQRYTHAGRLFLDAGNRRMAFLAHLKSLTIGGSLSALARMCFSLLPHRWQSRIWAVRHRQ